MLNKYEKGGFLVTITCVLSDLLPLTESANFPVRSSRHGHRTGHSQEVKLREILSLSAKSQIYSNSQEGVSSTELDFGHAWIDNELHLER